MDVFTKEVAVFEFNAAADDDTRGLAEVKLKSGEELQFSVKLRHDSFSARNCATDVEVELDFTQPSQQLVWYKALTRKEAAFEAVKNFFEVESERAA